MDHHLMGDPSESRPFIRRLLVTCVAATLVVSGCGAGSEALDAGASASATEDTTTSQTVDVESSSDETITLDDEDLTISQGGSYTLTGDSTASVVLNTGEDVDLILDGVNIVSETGAAIVVEEADNVAIILADGTENHLEDAGTRDDAEIDGTIYSTADLTISGSGSLHVTANYEDGIVTKDDLDIVSGAIVIDSIDEGIRGRDSISISGGDITITAGGDGLKTTNAEDLDNGTISITGGTLAVDAGDDAIKAATTITIDDGTIDIQGSLEGLEAINITINGGDITVNADDDGINAVAGDIATDVFIAINGGIIGVAVGPGDTDAFDANGSITITNGDITVTAPTSAFDYDTTAEMTGGTLTVNGEQLSSIPVSRMGGGAPGGGRPPGR